MGDVQMVIKVCEKVVDCEMIGCPHFFPHEERPECKETIYCGHVNSDCKCVDATERNKRLAEDWHETEGFGRVMNLHDKNKIE